MSLIVDNLTVKIDKKVIFSDINLKIEAGKIYLMIGKNGTGKTTILKTIMGNPRYSVVKGKIILDNQDIINKKVEERVKLGVTMSFQNPSEIEGVSPKRMLKSLSFKTKKEEDVFKVSSSIINKSTDNLSGGELKKSDLYLTSSIDFKYVLLDEPELSFDKQSLKSVANFITNSKNANKGVLLVTHNEKLIELVRPDLVYELTNKGLLTSK